MSENYGRQLGVANTLEETEESQEGERCMKVGYNFFNIHVKLYFMNLAENETLAAHGKGGSKQFSPGTSS
jgi:hypothetical protein